MGLISCPRTDDEPGPLRSGRDFADAYEGIVAAARRSAGVTGAAAAAAAVMILVAPDVDGVCAARALVALLREDEIAYRVVPCDGYATLTRIMSDDVVGNEELHTLVFLNLGALLPLPSFLSAGLYSGGTEAGLSLPAQCTLHVIDSHRPWNLENLFATSDLLSRICIWDDGQIEQSMSREQEAYSRLEFEASDSESDSDHGSESEDGESESDGDDDADALLPSDDDDDAHQRRVQKKRRRLSNGSSHTADEMEDEDAEASSSEAAPRGRRKRKVRKPARTSAAVLAQYRAVLARYHARGSSYGTAVSLVMWLLADRLGRATNETLWLGILGLTSQYLSSRTSYGSYEEAATMLAGVVRELNPVQEGGFQSRSSRDGGLPGKAADADDGRIRVIAEELRFTLYRHWSLESAMYHSAYVAGKINIWKERGLSQLRGLMAKMGFSLSQCRQTFDHMDLDLRRQLIPRIQSIAPEYGMTECVYLSFLRSFGYQSSPLSAADTVEGLSALLIAAHGVRIKVDAPGMTFSGNGVGAGGQRGAYGAATGAGSTASDLFGGKKTWSLGAAMDTGKQRAAEDGDEGEREDAQTGGTTNSETDWVRNFFAAYNALDARKPTSVSLLRASLGLSKALHSAIVSQGVALIEKSAVKTLRSFRVSSITEGPDLALFTNPNTLARLALWVVEALRDIVAGHARKTLEKKRERLRAKGRDPSELEAVAPRPPLPFVLAALDEGRDRFVVVGLVTDVLQRNRWGMAFQEAAAKCGARTKHDAFDSSVIEVKREDLSKFIEALHLRV